jgi:hypothetical protein
MNAKHILTLVAPLLAACGGSERGVAVVPGVPYRVTSPQFALAIVAPQPGEVVHNPVRVEIVVRGFALGAPTPGAEQRGIAKAAGQHIHLIVDNEPYQALTDVSKPIELPTLAPGPHAVRAFTGTQWHESIKVPGGFEAVSFFVDSAVGAPPITPGAPLLTYSRPKGTYAGADADSILLDFYVRNAPLLPGSYKVRLTIDNTQTERLTASGPYYLIGLAPGDHTIKLELLDPGGRVVPGPYNVTERTITVER